LHRGSHCCVINGVFEPLEESSGLSKDVRFRPAAALTPDAVAAILEQVRIQVLGNSMSGLSH